MELTDHNRTRSVWWEGDFRLSLTTGLALLFDLDPIDRTLALLSPCCLSLLQGRDQASPVCLACSSSAPVGPAVPLNGFFAPNLSDRDLLTQWGELYVDPLTATVLADALVETFALVEQEAYNIWKNDTTLVAFDAVVELVETLHPRLAAIAC